MNALLLACDTLAVKVIEATNAAAVIVEKTKNCCDVKITEKICCAIITVAGIAAGTILLWHLIQKISDGCKHRREIAKEKEENQKKIEKEYQTRVLDYMKEELNTPVSVKKTIKSIKISEEEIINKIKETITLMSTDPGYRDNKQELLNKINKLEGTINTNSSYLSKIIQKLETKKDDSNNNIFFENNEYINKIDSYLNHESNTNNKS